MRKRVPLALASLTMLGLVAGVARAAVEAEAIPEDFIKQFAPIAVQLMQQQFPTPPVKVDLDADKTQGMHVPDSLGVVLIPDRTLTEKTVAEAKDKKAPVAALIMRALSVEKEGAAVAADKVALLDVMGTFKLPTFFLDVKGDKEEGRTLELYSKKDDEPVVTAPLTKKEGETKSTLTVKLTNIDPEKKKADAILRFPGGYEASVKLAFVEP